MTRPRSPIELWSEIIYKKERSSERILIVLAAAAIIGFGCFPALAWRTSIAPIAPPPRSSFLPELITPGEVLAGAGYCATCHAVKGGKPYAGG